MKKKPGAKDPYQQKKQRIYVDAELWRAFGLACEAVGKSRSAVLTSKARSYVLANAPKLRKAGHRLPESIFTK